MMCKYPNRRKHALSAQHNNGGLGIDCWWQTNIKGLFAAGEVSASHGVYRPGGSALNAGQVGAARAARYIAAKCQGENTEDFTNLAKQELEKLMFFADTAMSGSEETVQQLWDRAARRMSLCGGPIRDLKQIQLASCQVFDQILGFSQTVRVMGAKHLWKVFRLWDVLLCQYVYLEAMKDFAAQGGKSRGSALYCDKTGGKPYENLPDMFRFVLDDGSKGDSIQEITLENMECFVNWRKVREIPELDGFFENVWRNYREHGNIN